MFNQAILWPQVKRCAIIICKYGIYGLSHECPNDLRLRILHLTAFSPLEEQVAHTRKKKKDLGSYEIRIEIKFSQFGAVSRGKWR